MNLVRLLFTFILPAIIISCSSDSEDTSNRLQKFSKGERYQDQGYYEYLPSSYGRFQRSPLIIYFHGLGHNGDGDKDLEKITEGGIPYFIKSGEWPGEYPFVILAPQQQSGCPSADEIQRFINFAISYYSVDPNRVYLTGVSCGAHGIAGYLAKYGGQQVAAVVPNAGNISPAWSAKGCSVVESVAIWNFQGDKDPSYSVDSQSMQKFIDCPQPRKDVRQTIFKDVGHESWQQTYSTTDIYTWLLGISR